MNISQGHKTIRFKAGKRFRFVTIDRTEKIFIWKKIPQLTTTSFIWITISTYRIETIFTSVMKIFREICLTTEP